MNMPGRTFAAQSGYRYGFNGKEKDLDAGEGIQDYGMRISDNRLGRFLSEDPITKKYPELTPYQFASNTPIQAIDLDGLEKYIIHFRRVNGNDIILSFETDNSLKYKCSQPIAGQPTIKPKVVQYIEEDANGKVLSTSAEIPLKNFGSTIYVGPKNPKDKDENDTYKYPAINSLDKAAQIHDKDYDKVGAVGAGSAFGDLKTIEADKKLAASAGIVYLNAIIGTPDPVNNEKINDETKDAAFKVYVLFSTIVIEKQARIELEKAKVKVKSTIKKIGEYIDATIGEAIKNIPFPHF
jgi:RHS repeat-associated protein